MKESDYVKSQNSFVFREAQKLLRQLITGNEYGAPTEEIAEIIDKLYTFYMELSTGLSEGMEADEDEQT